MRAAAAIAASVLLAGLLAGCAVSAPADGRVQVVASTNVYASIAAQIGGRDVDVTALIASTAQDPHDVEPSAHDRLLVQRADLIVANGGGYDPFVGQLVRASGRHPRVIEAATLSHDYPASGDLAGFNEHVFYDPETMARTADAVATALAKLRPADAARFAAAATAFGQSMTGLEGRLAAIAAAHSGAGVFVTEPLPLYLTAAAGLRNRTPPAFSEAVEAGRDVPPATLLAALALIDGHQVAVVITNAQAGGAETAQVAGAAHRAGIPVLAFSELLQNGDTYLSWMGGNIAALAKALG